MEDDQIVEALLWTQDNGWYEIVSRIPITVKRTYLEDDVSFVFGIEMVGNLIE